MTRAEEFHTLYSQLRIRTQLDFYRARRDEYSRANRQAIVARNTLLFLAAGAGIAGQVTENGGRAGWAVVAAVMGALAAAVTAYASLIGFPQLQKLYGDAVHNLEEASIDWDEAEPTTDLTNEVERVEGIFRSEVGQWGQLVVKEAAPPPSGATTDRGVTDGPSSPGGPDAV